MKMDDMSKPFYWVAKSLARVLNRLLREENRFKQEIADLKRVHGYLLTQEMHNQDLIQENLELKRRYGQYIELPSDEQSRQESKD